MQTAYEQFVNNSDLKKLRTLLAEALETAESLQSMALAARDQTPDKGKWLILDSFMETAEKIEDVMTTLPPARN